MPDTELLRRVLANTCIYEYVTEVRLTPLEQLHPVALPHFARTGEKRWLDAMGPPPACPKLKPFNVGEHHCGRLLFPTATLPHHVCTDVMRRSVQLHALARWRPRPGEWQTFIELVRKWPLAAGTGNLADALGRRSPFPPLTQQSDLLLGMVATRHAGDGLVRLLAPLTLDTAGYWHFEPPVFEQEGPSSEAPARATLQEQLTVWYRLLTYARAVDQYAAAVRKSGTSDPPGYQWTRYERWSGAGGRTPGTTLYTKAEFLTEYPAAYRNCRPADPDRPPTQMDVAMQMGLSVDTFDRNRHRFSDAAEPLPWPPV